MWRGGMPHRRGQASLVGLLVAIVIIMVVVWYVWLRPSGKPSRAAESAGVPQTTLGQAMQQGKDVACQNNLQQLRLAIQMEYDSSAGGAFPPALSPDWHAARQCPVSGQPYQYDPSSGRVGCTTPGHEHF